jgi:polysaccharide biosynthesis/export protein
MVVLRRNYSGFPVLLGFVLIGIPLPAQAEYAIMPGDTLAITITSAPDMLTKSVVDVDGDAVVPLVGPVKVSGLTLFAARRTIQSLLATQKIMQRSADGRSSSLDMIPAAEIGVSILEYRPIHVAGDVAKPGEQSYRPGLAVRDAIAVAGGYDILRYRMDNPFLQLADLRSEYAGLWINYAKSEVKIARLRAEIDGKTELDSQPVNDLPIAPSLSHEILENEKYQMAARRKDIEREKAYLGAGAGKESERADVLSAQRDKEQQGVVSDDADQQRYSELYKKGTIALPILSEARRELLLSSTRVFQTSALLAGVQRDGSEFARRLERVDDIRRIDNLKELQDETAALAILRAKLQAVSEKLRYSGMVKSQLLAGKDSTPGIIIHRMELGKRFDIEGTLDADLQPGDSVDVALQPDDPALAGAAGRPGTSNSD